MYGFDSCSGNLGSLILVIIDKFINSEGLYYLYMLVSKSFLEWEKELGPENKGFVKNIKKEKYRKNTLDPYLRARKISGP